MQLATERLVLRPPTHADAAAMVAYYNDPEIAAMQDWDLPQTLERVVRHIDECAALGGPTPGAWMNLVIEADGECTGHVACHLDPTSSVAEVGYTLAREHWGKGYASEALDELLNHLIATTSVHRFVASLDPNNVRSMRVLERAGFLFESLSERSYPMRGGWEDDLRYAMTRQQREAWIGRTTAPPTTVELVEVTAADCHLWEDVRTHHSEVRFVRPLTRTFRDLAFSPLLDGVQSTPVLRGVLADGERVGTVFWSAASPEQPETYLWRLIVDRLHQRRGIGRRIITELQQQLQHAGEASMTVSYLLGPGSPERFYAGLGFVATGRMRGPEVEARLSW